MERISSGQPLRVLGVGTFSMRKGAYDLVQMANITATKMKFRFVGDVPHDALSLKRRAEKEIEFIPRIPEYELKSITPGLTSLCSRP
jgi:hypothetical protein